MTFRESSSRMKRRRDTLLPPSKSSVKITDIRRFDYLRMPSFWMTLLYRSVSYSFR